MKSTHHGEKPKALLVSIKTAKMSQDEAEESLRELERLVSTLGFEVVAKSKQRRPSTTSSTVVGEGKLKELAKFTGGPGFVEKAAFAKKSKAAEKFGAADIKDEDVEDIVEESAELDFESDLPADEVTAQTVIFDCDLSPSQLRNLENALAVEVLDRTGVIIEIFSRHAKTRAAKLQVEIARLNYLAPRLRESTIAGSSERQAGRGSGESQLELDKRNIRDRVAELKTELAGVQEEQVQRRSTRNEQPCVALVGYTNAGKSSTMRALTGSEVLVQDKLFATLDTTVRALQPETKPRILVSDTVGFIKKLPHDLVASFRSTLDEAHNASLLLYVVDSSDPTFRQQLEVTREVLAEVGVEKTDSLLLLNKADRLDEGQKRALMLEFPDAILMSSREKNDVKQLREYILSFFEKGMVEEEFLIPYDLKGAIGDIRSHMRVVSENFEDGGVRMKLRAPNSELDRLKKKFPILIS